MSRAGATPCTCSDCEAAMMIRPDHDATDGLARWAVLALLTLTAACTRDASAVEGSQTILGAEPPSATIGQATARPVENQPVGPVPGIGDIPPLANPLQGDRSALQAGRRWFVHYNYSNCHGGRAGGGMGPSLRDPIWLYGSSPDRIFSSNTQEHNHSMPSW